MAYSYKGSNYKDTKRELVAAGDVDLVIDAVEERKSSNGKPMLSLTLKQDDAHLRIYHNIVLNIEWTDKNLGDLLAAIGENPREDHEIEWHTLKGEWVNARVRHREFNGQQQAEVHFFNAAEAKREPKEDIPF